MSTGVSREDLDRLAAEHVLGLLEGSERDRAERLAEDDPAFQAAVAFWRTRFSELDDTARPLPAGEGLWQRIESGLGREMAPVPAAAPIGPMVPSPIGAFQALWRSLAFWRMAGLTASFAALLLAVGVGVLATRAAQEPVLIAVLLTDQNRPAAIVNAFANGGAELIPIENIPVPAGRALELWAIPDPQGRPISVGVLEALRSTRLSGSRMPSLQPGQAFAISVEPQGGSPTGLPTGPVLMKGTASTAL